MGIDDEGRIEVVIKADETEDAESPYIGIVTGESAVFELDLTIPAGSHSNNDILADTQLISSEVFKASGRGIVIWQSLSVLDLDEQDTTLDVFLLRSNTSMGSEGASPSITGTNAKEIVAEWQVESKDWRDLGTSARTEYQNIGTVIKALTGSRSLYIAVIARGSHSATNGMHVKLGFIQE
jgi:hypothetical protein